MNVISRSPNLANAPDGIKKRLISPSTLLLSTKIPGSRPPTYYIRCIWLSTCYSTEDLDYKTGSFQPFSTDKAFSNIRPDVCT